MSLNNNNQAIDIIKKELKNKSQQVTENLKKAIKKSGTKFNQFCEQMNKDEYWIRDLTNGKRKININELTKAEEILNMGGISWYFHEQTKENDIMKKTTELIQLFDEDYLLDLLSIPQQLKDFCKQLKHCDEKHIDTILDSLPPELATEKAL